MNATLDQIHIREFQSETLSSCKPLASSAHTNWANEIDPPAPFKTDYSELLFTLHSACIKMSHFAEDVRCSKQFI